MGLGPAFLLLQTRLGLDKKTWRMAVGLPSPVVAPMGRDGPGAEESAGVVGVATQPGTILVHRQSSSAALRLALADPVGAHSRCLAIGGALAKKISGAAGLTLDDSQGTSQGSGTAAKAPAWLRIRPATRSLSFCQRPSHAHRYRFH